jgi:hypothetical protein
MNLKNDNRNFIARNLSILIKIWQEIYQICQNSGKIIFKKEKYIAINLKCK